MFAEPGCKKPSDPPVACRMNEMWCTEIDSEFELSMTLLFFIFVGVAAPPSQGSR
jgi:hypothetical protein